MKDKEANMENQLAISCCPLCDSLPTPKNEDGQIVLRCKCERHMAVGLTLDQVIFNWNVLIAFQVKEALHDKS